MKHIMLFTVNLEDFSQKLVEVPDDHPIVAFCDRWAAQGCPQQAYVDLGDDEKHLIDAWESAQTYDSVPLPTTVDDVVFGLAY